MTPADQPAATPSAAPDESLLRHRRTPLAAGEQSPAELAEARRYGHLQLVAGLADKLLDIVFLSIMAFLVARPVSSLSAQINPHPSVQLWLLFLLTTAIHLALSFPLSYYSGYWLEHRFALSHQTFGGWLWRYTKVHLVVDRVRRTAVVGPLCRDLDDRRLVVVGRRRAVLCRQRGRRPIGSGAHHAAVLQDPADR